MDKLQFIIHSLNEEEKKGFEFFVNRFRFREERLDVKLFKRLAQPEKLDLSEAFKILYSGAEEKEAYHALRKRLLGHLVEYISVKKINTENGSKHYNSKGLINLAEYLFKVNAPVPAWQYFNRAYASEVKQNNYDVLSAIYLMWLENWATYTGSEDFSSVYKKYLEVKADLDKSQALRLALSLIQRKFQQQKLLEQTLNIDGIIKDAIDGMFIKKKDFFSMAILPSLIDTLIGCCKERQDFDAILKFVTNRIKKISKKDSIEDELDLLYRYQLELLVKTGYFELAAKNTFHLHNKYASYKTQYQVLIGVGDFSGALAVIENQPLKNQQQVVNLLELLTVLVANEKFTAANQVLSSLKHSQAWLNKKMGAEWSCNYKLILLLIELQKNNLPKVLRLLKDLLVEIKQLEDFRCYYKNLYDVLVVMQRELKTSSSARMKKVFTNVDINLFNPQYIQPTLFVAFFKAKYSDVAVSVSLNEIINQFK